MKKGDHLVHQHKKNKVTKIVINILLITFGAIIAALGLELFLVPNEIIDGGIVGVSIMSSHILGVPMGIFLFIFNLPFLYFGYKQFGKKFAVYSTYGIVILSVCTVLLHHKSVATDDMLLAAIFGGIIVGIGVGLVIRAGSALDGTEIVAIVVSKNLPFSVGELIMFLNVFILGSAGFVFGWKQAMYSLIAYFIAFKTIDVVVAGLDEWKAVLIVSDHSPEIADAIIEQLGRGVTYLNGEGAYTQNDQKIIYCIITRLEEARMKEFIHDIDRKAFITIIPVGEVHGGRFKKSAAH